MIILLVKSIRLGANSVSRLRISALTESLNKEFIQRTYTLYRELKQ